jgi:glycosyltransferase involved in cell wall biosynthesis
MTHSADIKTPSDLSHTETIAQVKLPPIAERPEVSIIVPSYNQGRFIRATIDSILSQNYRPIRIYVIDGASKDETVEVLRSYGNIPELNWVSEPDKGVVDAVNKGFARVTGEIIAIQSSDDMYMPGTVQRIVETFRSNSAVGLVYGDTMKVDADGNVLLKYQNGPFSLENLFLFRTWIPQPSAFFRREMLQACGGWDERIPYAPDTDLWIRMAYRTKVLKIDEYFSQRRMHDAQRDTQKKKIIRDYCRMIDQSQEIAGSPRRIQQAAQAGKYLLKIRYNSNGSDWSNAWNRLMAGWLYPELSAPSKVVRDLTLPPRRFLSAIRKKIFCTHAKSE